MWKNIFCFFSTFHLLHSTFLLRTSPAGFAALSTGQAGAGADHHSAAQFANRARINRPLVVVMPVSSHQFSLEGFLLGQPVQTHNTLGLGVKSRLAGYFVVAVKAKLAQVFGRQKS